MPRFSESQQDLVEHSSALKLQPCHVSVLSIRRVINGSN